MASTGRTSYREMVLRGVRLPMTWIWEAGIPNSSWVSRRAVWIRLSSSGSWRPPGKLICPG
ncbi:hypothetical protein D3C72_1865220 [compost metagenome]